MTKLKELSKVLDEIRKCQVILMPHSNADVDAAASAAALRRFLENAEIYIPDGPSKPAANFLENTKTPYSVEPVDGEILLLLDTSAPQMLGSGQEFYEGFEGRKIIIDHHSDNALEGEKFVFESSSTCEILYHALKELDAITPEVAEILAAGIFSDTAGLTIASPETFMVLSELLSVCGKKLAEILPLFSSRPDISEKIARIKASKRAKVYRFGDFLIVTSEVGSFESSCASALVTLGADVAFVGSEKRIIGRANSRAIKRGVNLAEILKQVGEAFGGAGGGHPGAAGVAGIPEEKLELALRMCADLTIETLRASGIESDVKVYE